MRTAVWTPLPPAQTGVADYVAELLPSLAEHMEVTAITKQPTAAPGYPKVIPANAYVDHEFDRDVYHIGNNFHFHGYVHARALQKPGILVLHDLSLLDLYRHICGGDRSRVFIDELTYNLPPGGSLRTLRVDGRTVVDPLSALMCRRLVESSTVTIVHSSWARDELRHRFPGFDIRFVPEATRLSNTPRDLKRTKVVFGVIGGISSPKRILQVLEAFRSAVLRHPNIRLLISGRADDPRLAREIASLIRRRSLEDRVRLETDLSPEDLEQRFVESDVVIAMRWPTRGETSAIVMRAFGSGRPVIGSDVPQYGDLPNVCYRRVPTDEEVEVMSLTERMCEFASDPSAIAMAGRKAREFVEDCSFERVAEAHADLIQDAARRDPSSTTRSDVDRFLKSGVNAIASWGSTTGITEAARRAITAISQAGIPVALEDFDFGAPTSSGRVTRTLASMPQGRPYDVDLVFLNLNELHVYPEHRLRRNDARKRYVVGSWFWELPSIPEHIANQFSRVDEIWVASRFVADTFRQYTKKPIRIMPCVVEPSRDPSLTRANFGLSSRAIYLFTFDAKSTIARKNPFGVIRAFSEAFTVAERRDNVQLVMKCINLSMFPEARERLGAAIEGANGTLLDQEFTASQMAALVSLCDVYVSLHRAEGFGLGMAEAMYFGRAVVGTGYSGSVDFMTAFNSLPVRYRMTRITAAELRYNPTAEHIYTPGAMWADPDLEHAAKLLRRVYDHPDLRERLGREAAATMRRNYSSSRAGLIASKRLREIHESLR